MVDYIRREDVHLALDSHYFPGELSLRETIDSVPSVNVVELELSPVCYKCDGKTADGVRTEKCLWLNGDNSKCIE